MSLHFARPFRPGGGRVDCCVGWAWALVKLGRWSEALELYRQGKVLFEESGEVWLSLGQALGELGRWEEAVVESGRAVSLGFAARSEVSFGVCFGRVGQVGGGCCSVSVGVGG